MVCSMALHVFTVRFFGTFMRMQFIFVSHAAIKVLRYTSVLVASTAAFQSLQVEGPTSTRIGSQVKGIGLLREPEQEEKTTICSVSASA